MFHNLETETVFAVRRETQDRGAVNRNSFPGSLLSVVKCTTLPCSFFKKLSVKMHATSRVFQSKLYIYFIKCLQGSLQHVITQWFLKLAPRDS